jgi:hypothetical protein
MRHVPIGASCFLALFCATPAAALTVATAPTVASVASLAHEPLLAEAARTAMAPPAMAASRAVSAAALFQPAPPADEEAGQASFYPDQGASALPLRLLTVALALALAALAGLAAIGRRVDFRREP